MLPFTPFLKQRKRIAGAARIRRPLATPPRTLTVDSAMEMARREISRLGLATTHQVSALYAGEDRQTEGAAFAIIVRERSARPATVHGAHGAARLKLLIHHDGHIALHHVAR